MKHILFVAAVMAYAVFAQNPHHDAVGQRGDRVMGFSHDKTTHHFRLSKDGEPSR